MRTGKAERILLVEDDDDSREALQLLLEAEGLDVVAAATATDALDKLRTGEWDALVTDFHLPDETGGWIISRAREEGRLPAAVLIVTGGDISFREPNVKVLSKPVDVERIIREIGTAVHPGKRPPAAPVAPKGAIELVLYVTSASLASLRAIRHLHRVLADYDREAIHVRVLDVAESPDEAATDRVDFTPVLVRRSPEPRWRLLGDLRHRKPLDDLLLASGAKHV